MAFSIIFCKFELETNPLITINLNHMAKNPRRKFRNKYRVDTIRARWWDYSRNGEYFVTICTHKSRRWFGHVENGKMILSDVGQIAHDCWAAIPEHFPFVRLGKFVIMPDHTHGIVIIDKPVVAPQAPAESQDFATLQTATKTQNPTAAKNKFGPQSKNLGSIIRGFKVGVTKGARATIPEFAWKPRYHDHIIQHRRAFQNISRYIRNNPAKWKG